ncbi:DUF1293 family protein [Vibrio sp. 10N.247.310.17]|uniref:DUF1293 family protein n=1 Tax=Vibrio sp. 10N.247.310.17 TaxID=3229979 RepID=UPI00354CF2F9
MATRIFVLGIDFVWTAFGGEQAQLNISRPLRTVDTDNYKRRTFGESGDVNQKYDQPLMIDRSYAEMLEETGALVPRREYEVELGLNLNDPLSGAIVNRLIPVDDEIKKHFSSSLKQ